MKRARLSGLLLALTCLPVLAHQPVMDMAPRWQGGWGFQVRAEHVASDELLAGQQEVANPFGREKTIDRLWLEGIYTFRRELRLTLKLPWVDQERTVVRNGVAVRESGAGVGDLIIGVPMKRYDNQVDASRNIAFTPSIRLPTGSTADAFPVGDGSTDLGVSVSASFERADIYQYYDLFYWANRAGERGIHQGDELGLDINIGVHPWHDNLSNTGVFMMLDVAARDEQPGRDMAGVTGGRRLSAGPVLVWYRGGIMVRTEVSRPLYERVEGVQLSRGDEFKLGIGFVF